MASSSNRIVLNPISTGTTATSSSPKLEEVGLELQRSMLSLQGEYLAESGRGVDYHALAHSEAFKDYCRLAEKLNYVETESANVEERKAFYINIYNALTIHGLAVSIAERNTSSVLEIDRFWRNTCYNIGGLVYSLDDIEHGLLRCNRPHPGGDVMFTSDDPRLSYTMDSLDPRIHFALVCGAKSCPAIQVYTSKKLDRNLTAAAKSFCEQEVKTVPAENKVVLSKIFQWYSTDFGDNNIEVLNWITDYLPEDQQKIVREMVANGDSRITVEYSEYNWLLNKL